MKLRRGQEAYEAWDRRDEPIMLGVSLVFAVTLVVQLMFELEGVGLTVVTVLNIVIWLAFLVDYIVLFLLAPDRWQMVRTHKLEAVMVLVPLLRPLALLRIAPLLVGVGRAAMAIRTITGRPLMQSAILLGTVAIFLGGILVYLLERDREGASILQLGDGLWWAFVTATTVGYGDAYPVSPGGRIVAAGLMIVGISFLSVVTANLASYFIQVDDDAVERADKPDGAPVGAEGSPLPAAAALGATAEGGPAAAGMDVADLHARLGAIESQLERVSAALSQLTDARGAPSRPSAE